MMICPASHTRNPHLNSTIIFGKILEGARYMELVSLWSANSVMSNRRGLGLAEIYDKICVAKCL
jgi:hypothetical protein